MAVITVKEKTGAAIQSAVDEAYAAGGGRVELEPGEYLSGSIWLKSNVELHLHAGAKIQGFPKPDMYGDFPADEQPVAPEGGRKFFIGAMHGKNISITGNGEINGNGPAFYDTDVPPGEFFKKPDHPRTRMIQFFDCENVTVEGVSLVDSPGWTCWFAECRDVNISRIRITGNQQMINNDGIDIDSCQRVTVSDSFFKTGDDCLVLRAIRRDRNIPAICEKVVVNNCVLDSPCQGVRLGCPSDDTIRNCIFSNIVFRGAGSAVLSQHPYCYLRKECTGYLDMSDISFSNCDFEAGGYPFYIFCEGAIALRGIRNITLDNVRFRSGFPVRIAGNAASVITGVKLRNVTGEVLNSAPLEVQYVKNLQLENFQVTALTGELPEFRRIEHRSWETKF